MIGTDDAPTLRLNRADVTGLQAVQTTGIETLLFGLSLAAALPPAAILFPPNSTLRMVQSDAQTILTSAELGTILGRPTTMIGRGRIALGEVDRRMQSLAVSLEVFQVADGSGVLISLGVVTPHRTASGVTGA